MCTLGILGLLCEFLDCCVKPNRPQSQLARLGVQVFRWLGVNVFRCLGV